MYCLTVLKAGTFKIKAVVGSIPSEGCEGRIHSGVCLWLIDGHHHAHVSFSSCVYPTPNKDTKSLN